LHNDIVHHKSICSLTERAVEQRMERHELEESRHVAWPKGQRRRGELVHINPLSTASRTEAVVLTCILRFRCCAGQCVVLGTLGPPLSSTYTYETSHGYTGMGGRRQARAAGRSPSQMRTWMASQQGSRFSSAESRSRHQIAKWALQHHPRQPVYPSHRMQTTCM